MSGSEPTAWRLPCAPSLLGCAKNARDESEPHWVPLHRSFVGRTLAAAALLAVNLLILIAFSLEIHSYWWYQRWTGNYTGASATTGCTRSFPIRRCSCSLAAVLLTIGFLRRSAFLRWQALILLAATIAKVFLVDVSQLSQGLRILSFIGLGVLLLCVSYVYQRDWLNLRGQKGSDP